MNFKNFLCLIVSVTVLGVLNAKKSKIAAPVCGNNEERCKDLNDPCRCFCAYKPGPRDKTDDDMPVFIENDPAGIYCYCKPRDLKKYREDHKQD